MIIDCPLCSTRVLLTSSGECPRCRSSIADPVPAERTGPNAGNAFGERRESSDLDFCPICTGVVEGDCESTSFHRGYYHESLGPLAPGCPHCRELLVDDQCPECLYHAPNPEEVSEKHRLKRELVQLKRAYDEHPLVKLTEGIGCIAMAAGGFFILSGIGHLFAIEKPGRNFFRFTTVGERMSDFWTFGFWLLAAALLFGLVAFLLYQVGILATRRLTKKIEETKKRLKEAQPSPIQLYTTPLSLERIGPAERGLESHLLCFSPASQAKLYQDDPDPSSEGDLPSPVDQVRSESSS
jgi:hypothetical protein